MDSDCVCRPAVSVIMPAYNCATFIEEAIRSVLAQTFDDWELLVIDDASTDGTKAIAQRLANEDTRVTVLENPCNMGVARTRNRGLEEARGLHIAFLDGDDRWHSEKLQRQIAAMQQHRADVCYCSYAIVDMEGNPTKPPYIVPNTTGFAELLKENVLSCSTAMFSREAVQGRRFMEDFYHEDYCFWLDVLREGYRAVGCTDVLADWRLVLNSRSSDKKRCAQKRWDIYRKYLGLSLLDSTMAFIGYAMNALKKYYGKKGVRS